MRLKVRAVHDRAPVPIEAEMLEVEAAPEPVVLGGVRDPDALHVQMARHLRV